MAAGLVSHNVTTSPGVTFAVISWVPDTSAPDVGARPVHIAFDTTGAEVLTAAQVTSLLAALAAGATSMAKAEDVASANADVGVPAMAIQKATPADTAGTDGDYAMLQMSVGRLWTDAQSHGDVASDAVDSGNPVKVGARAIAGLSTATLVSAADRVDSVAGLDGAQIVRPHCGLEDIVSAVATCTAGANTSAISAQGAGIKVYVTSVIIRNAGTSNGNLLLTDGTGGTTKADIPFPASTGTVWNPPVPLPFSANTAIFVDPSGSDNIIVTVIGFKSKV
jgi:hypothetical protein